jgi:hypothetical protein
MIIIFNVQTKWLCDDICEHKFIKFQLHYSTTVAFPVCVAFTVTERDEINNFAVVAGRKINNKSKQHFCSNNEAHEWNCKHLLIHM